jgi:hypothetical protein
VTTSVAVYAASRERVSFNINPDRSIRVSLPAVFIVLLARALRDAVFAVDTKDQRRGA